MYSYQLVTTNQLVTLVVKGTFVGSNIQDPLYLELSNGSLITNHQATVRRVDVVLYSSTKIVQSFLKCSTE